MAVRQIKQTAPHTWLVWDEPLPIGKTRASGAAVYEWSGGNWSCDECGTIGGLPPAGSAVPHCEHIVFVQAHENKNKINLIAAAPAMLAALRAVEEAFSYTAPSALPSDAGVDWESVADQVDVAIYAAVNIGVGEVT